MATDKSNPAPVIGVVMGSASDWDVMQHAVAILTQFGIAHEARVVSAHRMPDEMFSSCSPRSAFAAGVKIGSASLSAWRKPAGNAMPHTAPVAW